MKKKTARKSDSLLNQVKRLFHATGDTPPKATKLLEKHHREFEDLFEKIDAAKGAKRTPIVREMATRLLAHMVIEETIFYPRALGIAKAKVLEGYEEHVVIRFALERLLVTPAKDKTFHAKMKTLKDFLVNHDDEEEKELFPKVRRAMTGKALRALGAEMLVRFDATLAAGWKKTLSAEGPHVSKRVRKASAR